MEIKKKSINELRKEFEEEQNVIDLVDEYGENNGMPERYAIGTTLSEEELMEKYPEVYPLYKPCKRLSVEQASFIKSSTKKQHADNERQRSHCYSLDCIDYEGNEYADSDTVESIIERKEKKEELNEAIKSLTETQARRLELLLEGLSQHEIMKKEGVNLFAVQCSLEQIKEKLKKIGF